MLAMKSVTIELLEFDNCCYTNTNCTKFYMQFKSYKRNFVQEDYIALFHHIKVVGKS